MESHMGAGMKDDCLIKLTGRRDFCGSAFRSFRAVLRFHFAAQAQHQLMLRFVHMSGRRPIAVANGSQPGTFMQSFR